VLKRILDAFINSGTGDSNKIDVLMIGSSGVGKTSTLTAMYEQFNRVIDKNIDLQLIPDDVTSGKLNRKLSELKKQIATDTVRTYPTVAGSKSFDSFQFFLAKDEDSKKRIEINFKDFPGGYLEIERQKVKEWLKESDVIVIPIDTPALIEEEGRYNEDVNAPHRLYEILRTIKGSFENRDRLVLFIPLKSEKYLHGDDYFRNHIRDRIESEYRDILDFFSIDSIKERVSTVITAIQTIGDIRFSMIEKEEGKEPVFIYKKRDHLAKYSPKDTEQPLKYILSFAIASTLRRRGDIHKKVSKIFNLDEEFLQAVESFSTDYKRDHNFVVLQGEELLKFKHEEQQ
jgi:hypothetical protein